MKITPGNALFIALVGYTGMSGAMLVNHLLQRRQPTPIFRVVDVPSWQQYADYGHTFGPAKSATTVLIFSDFQCPFCRRFSHLIDSLQWPSFLRSDSSNVIFPWMRFTLRRVVLRWLPNAPTMWAGTRRCGVHSSTMRDSFRTRNGGYPAVGSRSGGYWNNWCDVSTLRNMVQSWNAMSQQVWRLGEEGTPTVVIDGHMYPDGPPSRQEMEAAIRRDSRSR